MILKTFTIPACEVDRMHKLAKYLNGNFISNSVKYIETFNIYLAIVSVRFPESELDKFNKVQWIDTHKIYYKKVNGRVVPYNREMTDGVFKPKSLKERLALFA
jgi:hypothetical protein